MGCVKNLVRINLLMFFRYDTVWYLILFARNDRNCHKISVYNYPPRHNTYNSYNGVGQIEFNPESLQIIPRLEKL